MSDLPFFQRTPEELVDVLDLDGNKTHTITKLEAHKTGVLHACVIGVVKNSKDEWLFGIQTEIMQDKGQYVFPIGGHVKSGESFEQALQREAAEEMGLKDFDSKYIGKVIFRRKVLGNRDENHYFYLYEIYSDQEPISSDEFATYRYFSTEELKQTLINHPEQFGGTIKVQISTMYPQLYYYPDSDKSSASI